MFHRLIAAGAFALALFGAGAASAAPLKGDCLWTNLAQAKQDSLLSDYHRVGRDALKDLAFSESDIAALPAACGVNGTNARVAGQMIGATLFERGALIGLKEQFNVTPAQADKAWRDLGPDARGRLYVFTHAMMADEEPVAEDLTTALEKMTTALGLTGDAAGSLIYDYVLGRATREMREMEP